MRRDGTKARLPDTKLNNQVRNFMNCKLTAIPTCLALLLAGCSKSPDKAIESVLNRCAKKTEEVNASTISAAEAALFLAEEMQKMDTRNCPPDFRVAFQQHINAWRDASGAFSQNTGLNAFLESFAAGYFNDPSFIGVSQQNAAIANYRINATYNELVNIAVAHGARVPHSVVE